ITSCAYYDVYPFFFFQAEDGIRDRNVTGVQTCALPICPRISISVFSIESFADPISILIDSADRSPIIKLYFLRMYCMIASSILSQPTRIDWLDTITPSEITATSVVPTPISTIILPVGSHTGRPAPTAAANGSAIGNASLAPA